MEKYRLITSWRNDIEKVDIVSETESFVKLQNGRREAKISSYHMYYDTYEDAYNCGEQILIEKINKAISKLEHENNNLKKFKEKYKK